MCIPARADEWEIERLRAKVETAEGFLALLEHPEAEVELLTNPNLLRVVCHAFVVSSAPVVDEPTSEEVLRAVRWASWLLTSDSSSERWTAGSHLLYLYGQKPNLDVLELALANFGKLARVSANHGIRPRRTRVFSVSPLTDTQIVEYGALLTDEQPLELQSRVRQLLRKYTDLHISTLSMRTTSERYYRLVDIQIADAVRTGDTELKFISDSSIGRMGKNDCSLLEAMLHLALHSEHRALISERLARFAAGCTPRWWDRLRGEKLSLYVSLSNIAAPPTPPTRSARRARVPSPVALIAQSGEEERRAALLAFLGPIGVNATSMGSFQGQTARDWQTEINRWLRNQNATRATAAKLMVLLLDPPSLGAAKSAAEALATGFIPPTLARDLKCLEFFDLWFVANRDPESPIRRLMLQAVFAMYGQTYDGILLQLRIIKLQGFNRSIQNHLRTIDLSELSSDELAALNDSICQTLAEPHLRAEARTALSGFKEKVGLHLSCAARLKAKTTSLASRA